MSENDAGVVLAHGAWADGSSWSKVIAGLRSEAVKAVAAPLPLTSLADDVAALDQMLERVEGPVVVAGNAYAGRSSRRRATRRSHRWCMSPRLPPTRARRSDLAARGGVRQGFRPARLNAGAGAAGRHSAAARGGLHPRPGAASGLEGPAVLVPCGRGGSHDPRRDPAFHGGADEGTRAYGSRRPHAHGHGTVRGRRHRAGSGA
jgi:hypothetical protein